MTNNKPLLNTGFSLNPDLPTVRDGKVFLVLRGELEGRFDPIYYTDVKSFFNRILHTSQRLKEVVLYLKSGFGAGKQDQSDGENGIIQIRPTNIDSEGNLKFDRNVYLPENGIPNSHFLEKGNVLFNNTNSQELVGKTTYFDLDGKYSFSNHITQIQVNTAKILPIFLQIILNVYQRNKIFYSICTNWNNQSGIGLDVLSNLKIPVPPLEIQQQIVQKFEAAYAAKRAKEAEAAQLLASIDGYLLEALGITLPETTERKKTFFVGLDKVSGGRLDPFYHQKEFEILETAIKKGQHPNTKLSVVLTFIESGSRPSGGVSQYDEGVLSLGGEHVNNKCQIEVNNPKLIPFEYHSKNLWTETQLLDILLVKDGATTGKIGIIEMEEHAKCNINEHVFLMRFNQYKVYPHFVLNLLASSF